MAHFYLYRDSPKIMYTRGMAARGGPSPFFPSSLLRVLMPGMLDICCQEMHGGLGSIGVSHASERPKLVLPINPPLLPLDHCRRGVGSSCCGPDVFRTHRI